MVEEFRANLNLVNKRLAEESHKGTSFDPEKRAIQEIEGFGQYVNEVYNNLKKYAKTEPQQEFLNSEMDRFQHGFAAKYNDHLAAEGRTISSFITGGSNFPVSRAEKANVAEHKRYEEMIEYRDKAQATILRELKKMAIQEAGGELVVMKQKLANAERNHEFMVKANAIVRKKISDDQKIKEIIELGNISEKTVSEILKPDFMGRVGFPAYALSNDTANIARMKERIKEIEKKEATPSGDIEFIGGTIHDSKEDDRIQIFFDQKPPQEMINKLKGEGWRWAPSIGAWSRKRTDMALFSARHILGLEVQKPIFVPVKEQPKIDEEVHERIQKVIGIVKIYRDKGLTYEDLLVGLKGFYLQQSGYAMGSNLNAQLLIDDLKKSGYINLKDLWRKIITLAPEGKAEILESPKIPLLYPAPQPISTQPQPQKDKFAEIQDQMQRDRNKILLETAWQMTSKDFINESLKLNKYRASYEKNPNLMNEFTNSGIQKWKELVEKHGEIGKLPDKVIENYIQLFGEKALFSVFRGIKAKGIEGWRITTAAGISTIPSPPQAVIPTPTLAPAPINTFDRTTQRIRTARTLEELQTIRNEINTLPLFANERVKLLELYNTRYSLLLSEKPFGTQTQLPAIKPVFIGGLTPQEQRKKAQHKLSTPPARRLSEFGIGERAQRYYIPQRQNFV